MSASAEEQELLRRTASGDERAFTVLYRRYQQTVFRFAYLMTGMRSVADDITQEVFLVLMLEAGRFDSQRATLAAFLRGVARNHVLRHLRKDRRYAALTDDEAVDQASDWALDSAGLRRAVLALPEHYREAVILCDFEELTQEQAATILNIRPGTVASRLHRAHRILAERLGVKL